MQQVYLGEAYIPEEVDKWWRLFEFFMSRLHLDCNFGYVWIPFLGTCLLVSHTHLPTDSCTHNVFLIPSDVASRVLGLFASCSGTHRHMPCAFASLLREKPWEDDYYVRETCEAQSPTRTLGLWSYNYHCQSVEWWSKIMYYISFRVVGKSILHFV